MFFADHDNTPEPYTCQTCGETHAYTCTKPVIGHNYMHRRGPCACERQADAERVAEEEKAKAREERRRIRMAKDRAGLIGDLAQMTFDTLEVSQGIEKAVKRARQFCDRIERNEEDMGFWLVGPCGCGKTHITAAVANLLLGRDYRVRFWFAEDLIGQMYESFIDREVQNPVRRLSDPDRAEVLILDDLGTQSIRLSESGDRIRSELVRLFKYRVHQKLPTIITGNYPPSELTERLGIPLLERLYDTAGTPILVSGKSWRLKRMKERDQSDGL